MLLLTREKNAQPGSQVLVAYMCVTLLPLISKITRRHCVKRVT